MIVFKSYNDTYHALKIEEINLKRLEDKKEAIRLKYFKVTSASKDLEKDVTSYISATSYDDNYTNYLIELEETNIEQKIEEQKNIVNKLKYYLKLMNYHLSKLEGIEYQIFYEVVYNSKNVSKAIEDVAELNDKEPQTIWKYYYPNIKKQLNTFIQEKN